jgi:hypothetical protein
MTAARASPLIGAAVALLLGAGAAAADPPPQGAAAPSAPGVVAPPDNTPQPQPVTEQNNVPPVAPKEVAPPEPQKPPPDAAAALPKNVEPVMPAQAFSVLGKKVHGPDGKDVVGSIIDILVDDQGRPRAAIVDFGGFLGVGSRKIAVDWQLMKFHPTDAGALIVLDLDRSEIQAAPEYKDPTQPAEVVEPAVADAPPPAASGADASPPQADQTPPANAAAPVPPATPAPAAEPIAPPADAGAKPDAEKHPR